MTKRPVLRRALQFALPIAVLAGGVAIATILTSLREEEVAAARVAVIPTVRVAPLGTADVPVVVVAQGTVRPASEGELAAEVGGRIVEVSPSLAAGAFFDAGEVLVRIDVRDYELAVTEAVAELERAKLTLALEAAEAESARAEWQAMQRPGEPSPLAVREPQLREAQARVAAAEARLERARRDVERCVVRAPYRGRVAEKAVDLGQFVNRGTRLARIYATATAEVRLPVDDAELAFLDLQLDRRDGETVDAGGPTVELVAEFAGRIATWRGRIARTEGQLDPTSRMVTLVALVDDPYAPDDADTPPLLAGMFVTARIHGTTLQDVYPIPRAALRGGSSVLVVDADDRLFERPIAIVRRERDDVLARGEFAAGDRLCVTPLEIVAPGMPVRVAADPRPEPAQPAIAEEAR